MLDRGAPALFTLSAESLFDQGKAEFERLSDRALYPDQVEEFVIRTFAYMLSLANAGAQAAIEQNLTVFAVGEHLDAIGVGALVARLPGEDDERYRLRVIAAPELLSRGGPRAGYRARVMAIDAAVLDVAVIRSEPGHIHLHPLMATGAPDR